MSSEYNQFIACGSCRFWTRNSGRNTVAGVCEVQYIPKGSLRVVRIVSGTIAFKPCSAEDDQGRALGRPIEES